MYTIKLKKRVQKNLEKMPVSIQDTFFQLVDDLERFGPVQSEWPNYSKLSQDEYHCHLSRKWVACWRNEKAAAGEQLLLLLIFMRQHYCYYRFKVVAGTA